MNTKLTLKIEESIIEKAKTYAKDRNISLSKMIESYLLALTSKKNIGNKPSPLVESLTGVIKIEEEDYRKDYASHLSEKYK